MLLWASPRFQLLFRFLVCINLLIPFLFNRPTYLRLQQTISSRNTHMQEQSLSPPVPAGQPPGPLGQHLYSMPDIKHNFGVLQFK